MKLEVEKVQDYELRGGHSGRVIVFADSNRPISKGDIVGDFSWRSTHKTLFPKKQILDLVKPILDSKGIIPTRISYSRKAGCSICPCSPGYIIYETKTM